MGFWVPDHKMTFGLMFCIHESTGWDLWHTSTSTTWNIVNREFERGAYSTSDYEVMDTKGVAESRSVAIINSTRLKKLH